VVPEDAQVSTVASALMPHQVAVQNQTRHVALSTAAISFGVALAGLLFAWLIYYRKPQMSDALARGLSPLHAFSRRKWFFDELYDFLFVDTILLFSRMLAWFDDNVIDRIVNMTSRIALIAAKISGWFDKYIVDGVVNFLGGVSQFFGLILRTVQGGKVQNYIAITLVSVVFMIFLVRYFFVGA